MVLVFLISEGSVFHNLGADKEKARSAVLLSALEIVFGTVQIKRYCSESGDQDGREHGEE